MDISYLIQAMRALLRRPGRSLSVISVVALGVGFSTLMFTLVDGVLLTPLPYAGADRVYRVQGMRLDTGETWGTVSYLNLMDVGTAASVEGTGVIDEWTPTLAGDGEPERLVGATVDASFFEVLGVRPALGGGLRPADAEGVRAVMITPSLWQRRFGSDPGVLGRVLDLNAIPYEVVGVLPADWEDSGLANHAGDPEVWRLDPGYFSRGDRDSRSLAGIIRVGEGVSEAALRSEVDAVAASLRERFPDENAGRGLMITPLKSDLVGGSATMIRLLFGGAVVLLFIAASNAGSVMLVSVLSRMRQFAVRRAVGARARHIIAPIITESMILCLLGGLLGLVFAGLSLDVLRSVLPADVPRLDEVALDPGVMVFVVASILVLSILIAAAPAIWALRSEATAALRPATGASVGRAERRIQSWLVAAQIALSLSLLVAALLLTASLDAQRGQDLGYRTEGTLTFQTRAAFGEFDTDAGIAGFWRSIVEDIGKLPGVAAVGTTHILPLDGSFSCDGIAATDAPPPAPGQGHCAETRIIGGDFLSAMAIDVVAGRELDGRDDQGSVPTVLLSRSMAETLWPRSDPLGRSVRIHGQERVVVGITEDIRPFSARRPPSAMAYLPLAQNLYRSSKVVIRVSGDPSTYIPMVQEVVRSHSAASALAEIRTLGELRAGMLERPRFAASLGAGFGVSALLLSAVGLGALMSFLVIGRTREIGLRMSVGASSRRILGMVLRDALRLVGLGVAVGSPLALAAALGLRSQLFGVSWFDPGVFISAAGALAVAGIVAGLSPALRASRVQPMEALRAD